MTFCESLLCSEAILHQALCLREVEKWMCQVGEEIPFSPQAAAEIAIDNRRRLDTILEEE